MEIRDIKIINQCLQVQGGVVASFSFLFFFMPASLTMFIPGSFSPFFCLSHISYFALSLEAVKGSEPRSQYSKSGFKCSHTRVCPTGTIPTSHLAVKVEDIVFVVRCVCVSAAAISRQLIAQLCCCNLLMDHL